MAKKKPHTLKTCFLPSKLSSKWFPIRSNLGDAATKLTWHHPGWLCSSQLCRGDAALVHSVIVNQRYTACNHHRNQCLNKHREVLANEMGVHFYSGDRLVLLFLRSILDFSKC